MRQTYFLSMDIFAHIMSFITGVLPTGEACDAPTYTQLSISKDHLLDVTDKKYVDSFQCRMSSWPESFSHLLLARFVVANYWGNNGPRDLQEQYVADQVMADGECFFPRGKDLDSMRALMHDMTKQYGIQQCYHMRLVSKQMNHYVLRVGLPELPMRNPYCNDTAVDWNGFARSKSDSCDNDHHMRLSLRRLCLKNTQHSDPHIAKVARLVMNYSMENWRNEQIAVNVANSKDLYRARSRVALLFTPLDYEQGKRLVGNQPHELYLNFDVNRLYWHAAIHYEVVWSQLEHYYNGTSWTKAKRFADRPLYVAVTNSCTEHSTQLVPPDMMQQYNKSAQPLLAYFARFQFCFPAHYHGSYPGAYASSPNKVYEEFHTKGDRRYAGYNTLCHGIAPIAEHLQCYAYDDVHMWPTQWPMLKTVTLDVALWEHHFDDRTTIYKTEFDKKDREEWMNRVRQAEPHVVFTINAFC